jgi:hypothetical protein
VTIFIIHQREPRRSRPPASAIAAAFELQTAAHGLRGAIKLQLRT